MRRHRREGGVQCRAGSTQSPATGLSVAAGWESRSPSEVESDDQATNPARGGEVPPAKQNRTAVPIAPQPLHASKASSGRAAARMKVSLAAKTSASAAAATEKLLAERLMISKTGRQVSFIPVGAAVAYGSSPDREREPAPIVPPGFALTCGSGGTDTM